MAENDSFVFYLEWIDYLEMLPPDKAMEILKAIVGLIRDEKTVQFTDPGQNMAYSFIANQVKRDKRKYKEVVSKRAEAGRKGGLAKQANARSAKQSLANLAVNVNDNVNVNVNDNDIIPPRPLLKIVLMCSGKRIHVKRRRKPRSKRFRN